MKKSLLDKALLLALQAQNEPVSDCFCRPHTANSRQESAQSQLEHRLHHLYEREPDFNDLMNKLLEKALSALPHEYTQAQFEAVVDEQFTLMQEHKPRSLKAIPEEKHKSQQTDHLIHHSEVKGSIQLIKSDTVGFGEKSGDSDDEDEKISVDSFTGAMERSFLLDTSQVIADFDDLLAKIQAQDQKAIEEYDYQLLLTASCENLDDFPDALAQFVQNALTIVNGDNELFVRSFLKQIKVLVINYPGLFKETISCVFLSAAVNAEEMSKFIGHAASDLIATELDHYWILHPPASQFTSPIITEVVKRDLLHKIDKQVLSKLFLKRSTRMVLINELCANETLVKLKSSPIAEMLFKQVIFYTTDFKCACICKRQAQAQGHLCADELLRQELLRSPDLSQSLFSTIRQFNF